MSQDTESSVNKKLSLPEAAVLFRFNGVPVVAQPDFWPAPIMLVGVLSWLAGVRDPHLSWLQRLGAGLLAMLVALPADLGHAMAHTVSARVAGAPMDEIRLSSGMPRTLYVNNDVPPKTHIQRSLGGPFFNIISIFASLLWMKISPRGSLSRDLADVSLAAHTFILSGSVVPLPMVDGGIILKWKLVEAGKSPEAADQMVHKTSLALGIACLGLGAIVGLIGKRKLAGGLLAAGGAAGVAAGKGWLK
jgi:hypothetical protein